MPTYQYACTQCGDQVEAVQKFTDDPLSVCSACGGRLRKVFSPVGIVFKGSGFYRTDSRKGAGAPSVAAKDKQAIDAAASPASSEKGPADGKAADKSAAKAETAGTSSSSASEKAA